MKAEHLVEGPSESIILDNGVELTWFELGNEHEEIMVFPGFYFYTFYDVAKELAKKYHVYGIVMRFNGKETQVVDGKNQWHLQWGEDVYKFCKAKGIEKFHYFGKCHGTNPGWYLAKNHPEMLETFCSFTLAPHVYPPESNVWGENLKKGAPGLMEAMKDRSKFPRKAYEVKMLGSDFSSPIIPEFGGSPEKYWDNTQDLMKFLTEDITVPVCFLFGTADPLFNDFKNSNIWAMMNTKGSRSVILEGERHLMECDDPAAMAWEAFKFIEKVKFLNS